MNTPLVNIVIITFNGYKFTEPCISSIFNCNYSNFKIFLVDNGSDIHDYSKFFDKHKDNKKIEFIRLEKNKGFGGGCNAAIKRIKSGYIAFLNNDTIVSKDWLDPIISYMEKNPEVGICQPKIKDLKRKDYFEYAGAAGGFMDAYGFPFSRGRIFFNLEKDYGQYDDLVDIVWSGVAIVTKKEALDKTGYYDEIFFLYSEEVDLCWRMNHAGFRVVYMPQSVIYHYGGRKNLIDNAFYNHRNTLILIIKNYSISELLKYLPIRLFFDVMAFFYYIFGHTPAHCVDMMKAYWSLLTLMPEIIQHRNQVNKLKEKYGKTKYKYPIYQKSIVIEYFLKGKKTFRELDYSTQPNNVF